MQVLHKLTELLCIPNTCKSITLTGALTSLRLKATSNQAYALIITLTDDSLAAVQAQRERQADVSMDVTVVWKHNANRCPSKSPCIIDLSFF